MCFICWFQSYREGLGEGYDRDIAFASALETFGGHNDPICAAFGGKNISVPYAVPLLLAWEGADGYHRLQHQARMPIIT